MPTVAVTPAAPVAAATIINRLRMPTLNLSGQPEWRHKLPRYHPESATSPKLGSHLAADIATMSRICDTGHSSGTGSRWTQTRKRHPGRTISSPMSDSARTSSPDANDTFACVTWQTVTALASEHHAEHLVAMDMPKERQWFPWSIAKTDPGLANTTYALLIVLGQRGLAWAPASNIPFLLSHSGAGSDWLVIGSQGACVGTAVDSPGQGRMVSSGHCFRHRCVLAW